MKIIYLHQYFNTPEMSGGTRSYEMAKRMVAAGHDVHIVTSVREKQSGVKGWFTTTEAGIKVHWYPVPYSNYMSFNQRIAAFLSFAFAASKKSAALDGNVIFATSTPLTIALPAVSAMRKLKVPLVFEVRDLWPEMPIAVGALNNPALKYFAKQLERWAYRNSDVIVTLSPGMRDGVLKTGYPPNQIAVIPNSSDNLEFKHNPEAAKQFRLERPWLGDNPLLIYAGTFGKMNGLSYMVELAIELKKINSEIKILLVGEGAEKLNIVTSAKNSGVFEDNFFIEPAIPKKDIPALLSAATMASNLVIDLPEARANSANKFFDTLAAGKPILLNHGGWMHDLVELHSCGLAAWQQPLAEVAQELNCKMYDVEWLGNAGKAARALAEKEFDRDLLASQLMSVISAVVEKKNINASDIAPGIY